MRYRENGPIITAEVFRGEPIEGFVNVVHELPSPCPSCGLASRHGFLRPSGAPPTLIVCEDMVVVKHGSEIVAVMPPALFAGKYTPIIEPNNAG